MARSKGSEKQASETHPNLLRTARVHVAPSKTRSRITRGRAEAPGDPSGQQPGTGKPGAGPPGRWSNAAKLSSERGAFPGSSLERSFFSSLHQAAAAVTAPQLYPFWMRLLPPIQEPRQGWQEADSLVVRALNGRRWGQNSLWPKFFNPKKHTSAICKLCLNPQELSGPGRPLPACRTHTQDGNWTDHLPMQQH